MNGNILILMSPLGASVMPTVFLLSAYFHADEYDLMQLKNDTDVPYISDIGNYKPHSSVFTFGLNLSAMFGLLLILVRYMQVKRVYRNIGSKANLFGLICGLFGILGQLIVGSFQLSSHFTMHYLGAFMHFVSIMIFMFIQTFITHRNIPKKDKYTDSKGNNNSKLSKRGMTLLAYCRWLLSILLFASVVVFGIFLDDSLSVYNRRGYSVAQSAEWVMLGCVIVYMLTFLYDFKGLKSSLDIYSEDPIEESVKTEGICVCSTDPIKKSVQTEESYKVNTYEIKINRYVLS